MVSKKNKVIHSVKGTGTQLQQDAHAKGRFADNGELKYSLRSLSLYAPWIRNVYIVTDNQCPAWINREYVTIVDHKEIFPEFASLPCFSSRAIELCVHRIGNLSEHFLLFNDDCFLGSMVFPNDFFLEKGDPVLWVVKKKKKYRPKLLADDYPQMSAYRGADVFSRRLILKRYNKYLPYRVRHYPKPMLRTAMEEIWNMFPQDVERTLAGHFRKTNDLLIATFFSYFMIATQRGRLRTINGLRAVTDFLGGRVRHITANVGGQVFHKRMKQIKNQKPLTFCINDAEYSSDRDRKTIPEFLSAYFADKCFYER